MYENQPAVRKVVDYIARNTAQLGLKLYERESDTERRRDTDHAAILTMDHPNDLGPADQFIFNFVADFLVHENAYALMFRSKTPGCATGADPASPTCSRRQLRRSGSRSTATGSGALTARISTFRPRT